MTAAQALEALRRQNRRVAAVVNEYGETIGILPVDDILDTIFSPTASRSERLWKRLPIRQVAPDAWHVTGMTSVRRLLRHFQVEGLHTQSVTVGGIILEMLGRLPQRGDECHWGPFHFKVVDVPQRGRLLVEVRLIREEPT
jgi:CBS domain containing-hemolysin-like protein